MAVSKKYHRLDSQIPKNSSFNNYKVHQDLDIGVIKIHYFWVWCDRAFVRTFAELYFYHVKKMIEPSIIYTETDRVRDIIEDNPQLLLVLNRFRIPFGFGNRTIGEVCSDNSVDSETFLAVANLISNRKYSGFSIHLPTLVCYLKEAHSYILDYILPDIKDVLITGVYSHNSNDVALLVLRFFDGYMEEVRNHMRFEDEYVFAYIDKLQKGIANHEFRIRDFAAKHDNMVSKLKELKDIFLQHYSLQNTRELNRALFNIISCGEDMISHCEIENRLLVPAIECLEQKVLMFKTDCDTASETDVPLLEQKTDDLSEREKDIVRLVAYGLSNKEIADRLCLSFHTITTYRRNLGAKLNIHSTAGLVIYGILHDIVSMEEIRALG